MGGNRFFRSVTRKYEQVESSTPALSSYSPAKKASKAKLMEHETLMSMALCFVSGLGLAIGHHCFYASLAGIPVTQTRLDQQWNVRIGTAFAYLISLLFVVAVSIAYTQRQWLTTSLVPLKVRQIDAFSSIIGNVFQFLNTRQWLRYPLLLLLAGVRWLIPLGAIVTPATLSVAVNHEIIIQDATPPQLYYDPLQYAVFDDQSPYLLQTLSVELSKTIHASAYAGRILPIPAQYANQSYTLRFYAPALECAPADSALISEVALSWFDRNVTSPYTYYRFAAWPGNDTKFVQTPIYPPIDWNSVDAAHIYVIPNTTVNPQIPWTERTNTTDLNSNAHYGYEDLLDCKLHNASYEVAFEYSSADQTIDIRSRELLNPVNAYFDLNRTDGWAWFGPGIKQTQSLAQQICYRAIMQSFCQVLTGYEIDDQNDGMGAFLTTYAWTSVDWTTRESARRGLETLFQNITISLLSSTAFTMNETIASQHQVPTRIVYWRNVYAYDRKILWLTYGLLTSFSLVCVLVGAHALWHNGASYSNVFSTFLRTAQDPAVKPLLDPSDAGYDPLPKQIGEMNIVLGRNARGTNRTYELRTPKDLWHGGSNGSEIGLGMSPLAYNVVNTGYEDQTGNNPYAGPYDTQRQNQPSLVQRTPQVFRPPIKPSEHDGFF